MRDALAFLATAGLLVLSFCVWITFVVMLKNWLEGKK